MGRGEKKNPKESREQVKNHKTNKCFPWVTSVRVLSLAGSHSPPQLPRLSFNTVLVSGSAVGEFGPTPVHCCSQCPQLSKLMCFLLWEPSMSFYIVHRHRVCLVERVNLICTLYSWWEGFGSSSLATLPLGFNCGFISTSARGLSTGHCSWGCPGELGSAPVRFRCGGGAAAWAAGILAVSGTQGNWWLGQKEI